MSRYTKLPGVPDSDAAVPGMAYFAGTGPAGETCGTCAHRCMPRVSRKAQITYRYAGCAMYRALARKYGPAVDKTNEACKYFEKARGRAWGPLK